MCNSAFFDYICLIQKKMLMEKEEEEKYTLFKQIYFELNMSKEFAIP